jgi:hypothetical protein
MPRRASITIQGLAECLEMWLAERSDAALAHEAESLPLRNDMVTFLTFVRDNKVVGTQATGSMPLKAVGEVTAQFVHPPKLEEVIGDETFRIRSETDVWALYFLHILADVGGLLKAARVRRWRLTGQAQEFLTAEPRLQAVFLLAIWWYRVNWIVRYSYEGMGRALPPGFSRVTLAGLRSLPGGVYVSFEEFADRLIARTGLRWPVQDRQIATIALHGAIRAMVIDLLAEFGALERKYRDEAVGKGFLPRLVAFKMTPWGAALLEALHIVGLDLQRGWG